jgi:hypothetical protein
LEHFGLVPDIGWISPLKVSTEFKSQSAFWFRDAWRVPGGRLGIGINARYTFYALLDVNKRLSSDVYFNTGVRWTQAVHGK